MKRIYSLLCLCIGAQLAQAQCVDTFPYLQNFESGAAGWVAGGSSGTWVLGTPAKSTISGAASGANAWVTSSLTADYQNNEQSFVSSPCFDFTTLSTPIIEMKVWWSSEFSYDGVVLQSSTNNGATWQNVGAMGDPNNWYNDNSISGLSWANTGDGWTDTNTNSSGGWVTAKHDLSGLGGQSNVRLRFAFGTDGSVTYNGFAFDDVMIYTPPANDVGVIAITAPGSNCNLQPNAQVTVQVRNFGSASQSNIPVNYRVNNGPVVSASVAGPLVPNGIATFTFPTTANLGTAGRYTFKVWTSLPNDALHVNDTLGNYTVTVGSITSFPYTEDFEGGMAGWEADGTASTWAFGTPAKTTITGTASGTNAWVTGGLGNGQYNANEESYVQSPCMNFSTLNSPVIEMKIWWNSEEGYDGAVLQASTNGTTWTSIGNLGDSVNWYNDDSLNGLDWANTNTGWAGRGSGLGSGRYVVARHDLTGLGNQNSVRLRIAFGSDGSVNDDGFAFDDIVIYDKPQHDLRISGLVPFTNSCGLDSTQAISVRIRNLGTNPATSFSISYQIDNQAPVTETFTGTVAALGNTTYTFAQTANLSNPGSYRFKAYTTYALDPNTNDTLKTTIFNTLISLPQPSLTDTLDFEAGPGAESVFSLTTRAESRIFVDPGAARTGQYGLVLHGGNTVGWQPVVYTPTNPTVSPWNPLNNPAHFAAANLCLNTTGLDSLRLSFSLKQLKGVNFTETNFRITANGQPVPMTRSGVSNLMNLTPPLQGAPPGWEEVTVDLTPLLTGNNLTIGFESSVSGRFGTGTNATANLVDNIVLKGTRITGAAADQLAQQLKLYPNPNDGRFTLELASAKGSYQLQLMDVTGQTIWERSFTAAGHQRQAIEVAGQAKGVYFLRISHGTETTVQKVVVY